MKKSGGTEEGTETDREQRGDVRSRDKNQERREGKEGKKVLLGSASVCPPPPHLADEGELPHPDVVPIQPQGEDGS